MLPESYLYSLGFSCWKTEINIPTFFKCKQKSVIVQVCLYFFVDTVKGAALHSGSKVTSNL